MNQTRRSQLLLPFRERSELWEQLPTTHQDRCRAILAQLLEKVVRAERKRKSAANAAERSTADV